VALEAAGSNPVIHPTLFSSPKTNSCKQASIGLPSWSDQENPLPGATLRITRSPVGVRFGSAGPGSSMKRSSIPNSTASPCTKTRVTEAQYLGLSTLQWPRTWATSTGEQLDQANRLYYAEETVAAK
jgi:hypothetical protein